VVTFWIYEKLEIFVQVSIRFADRANIVGSL